VVPRADIRGFTLALAAEMADHAPLALKGTKRILNLLASALAPDEAGRQEASGLAQAAFQSEDLREGLRAFAEKRKPDFKNL